MSSQTALRVQNRPLEFSTTRQWAGIGSLKTVLFPLNKALTAGSEPQQEQPEVNSYHFSHEITRSRGVIQSRITVRVFIEMNFIHASPRKRFKKRITYAGMGERFPLEPAGGCSYFTGLIKLVMKFTYN